MNAVTPPKYRIIPCETPPRDGDDTPPSFSTGWRGFMRSTGRKEPIATAITVSIQKPKRKPRSKS